jgi:2-polyprenyl-3-methyl-5-hydroxy-6-metoxy-1,4-benzoquinol methylase
MDTAYVAAYADLYRRHWWWRVRERILLDRIRELLGDRAPHARILDIGCGAGLFFDALEQFGHVEGIESDPIAVEQSGRWRTRIHAGDIETFAPERPFDLVLALDVVEHVPNPEVMLSQGARFLARDGRMLITTPAFDWLWTSHDRLNHHVKRYTAGEMRDLVSAAGLTPIDTQYLFQSLILPKLIVRMRETLRPSVPSVPKVPPRALNRALETWFRVENDVAGWLPFGSSVMAVASAATTRRSRT